MKEGAFLFSIQLCCVVEFLEHVSGVVCNLVERESMYLWIVWDIVCSMEVKIEWAKINDF